MTEYASDIAFTEAVKSIQKSKGSRDGYARMEEKGGWQTSVDAGLAHFIGEQNSFYLGTASADGQPYIQHRGGKAGFLKILDETTLAFADFKGNRQYISSGNLSENNKSYIFLMDYLNRQRIKIWGTAHVSTDHDLMHQLADHDYRGIPEQAIIFNITAWDANCPQHITPRYTETKVAEIIAPLNKRIEELEAALDKFQGEKS